VPEIDAEGEPRTGVLSDAAAMGGARRLRAISWSLEIGIALIVALSVIAIGSVHPWAYVPLWIASLLSGVFLVLRAAAIRSLRRVLGGRRFAFHPSDRWLALDAQSSYGLTGWTFDLSRPIFPRACLFRPGLVFLIWVALQLVPLPFDWRPVSVSPPDTTRGALFLATALLIHVAAVAVLDQREARERLRRVVAVLGLAISLVAILQLGAGARRIYGLFEPQEPGLVFGPFVNRNHFAGYMLMVVPTCLALLAHAWRRYDERVGEAPNSRRRLLALTSAQGTALLYAAIPVSVSISALVATTSRGALTAFAASLALAALGLRRRERGVPVWAIALAFAAMAVSWFGFERLEIRFQNAAADAPGRTLVWRDALHRMDGRWLRGAGFNAFASAMSGATPWALPLGAEAWPSEIEGARRAGRPAGTRVAEGVAGLTWYREAHNDYLQVLVETGVLGLALALWAAVEVLAAARRDPWLIMAMSGILMHSTVDFDLQIPAIGVLFVVLAASRVRSRLPPC
jgi:putative inorganic carbon (HCO3(-)) transporter